MVHLTESQGLEFKSEVRNFRDISKTVCAFANAFGGRILIGISNDGKTLGVPNKEMDTLQQRLEGAIQQISPVPLRKIMVETREDKPIIVVEIYPVGQNAFCTFGGITYYRAGSSNTKLEGRTLQDFLVNRRILSFDESISKAKLEDIDGEKLRAFLQKRSPSTTFDENGLEEYLLNLGIAEKDGEFLIKNVALLFFSKDPSRFVPQNEIKLVRFKGMQPIDIIDSRIVCLDLLESLKETEIFIKKNTRTAFRIEKLEHQEVPEYPSAVIREAVINAVVHRDYFSRDSIQINIFDDRIEFINPGILPAGLSLQILGTLSIKRNPVIYGFMRDLRLIEGYATGIPRMRTGMRDAGLPEPRFEELGNFFRVTLYNSHSPGIYDLNERQKRALAYLEKNPSINSKTYIRMAGISHPMAVSDLNILCAKGLLKRVGKTRGSYYIRPS